jgi:hypothetical protein
MKGMDVHHIIPLHLGGTDDPSNLVLITPEEHAKIHNQEFVKWARKGALLGNEALRKRIKEKGYTELELENHQRNAEKFKTGFHRVPHSEETKRVIGAQKKQWLKDKTNHPMWGNTTYEITDPEGDIHIVSGGIKQWCKDRNLECSNLRGVAQGKRKQTKGYTAKII